ncbi:MAG: AAA family ATPase [Acidimicrobiales bacterium]|nr:AAA family ATPase [Acidimicrobiales bacterium]
MILIHPDFKAEQEYIENAYEILERAHLEAKKLHNMVESGKGGTHQARFEKDVIADQVGKRLSQLDIGDASLVFGRIDQYGEDDTAESFYIGRIAVWDEKQDPITVDWRAPISEPFYRATGREAMGLTRRRHFASRGKKLLGIEDEFFGEDIIDDSDAPYFKGRMTLAATMEQARTGRLGDIIATIQGEQDEIIRAPLAGPLVVQGGPGTGKTVVALHRAAYLLYTHRFPLEGQGVLVVGPNRVFLTYIEQVLPSLGEAGVHLAVLGDLVHRVKVRGYDSEDVARIKGNAEMRNVIRKAIRDRERPLKKDLLIGYGLQRLRLRVEESALIISEAKRRYKHHNAARSYVKNAVFEALAASSRSSDLNPTKLMADLGNVIEIREAMEWMWPTLTPEHLIHDLFGSKALLKSAARNIFAEAEILKLYRERSGHASSVIWTKEDAPILDEAQAALGPRSGHKEEDAIRTFGHIVVDEAQDLSPMEIRMLDRRSLNGSFTLVGDMAQATGAWAKDDWNEILNGLSSLKEPRFSYLTVGYRLPQPTMDVASRVLVGTQYESTTPNAVREHGEEPKFIKVETPARLLGSITALVRSELDEIDSGTLAVITPDQYVKPLSESFKASSIEHGLVDDGALTSQVTIVPVDLVKGLEIDIAIVIEPSEILHSATNGERSLYVALTRATRRLLILHADDLPEVLQATE